MRCALVLFAIFGLLGCERRSSDFTEAELTEIKAENPGMTSACIRSLRRDGMPGWLLEIDKCFRMMPAKRWHGVWRIGFEWSNFCPSPARDCPIFGEPGVITLERAEGAYSGPPLQDGLYAIDFIGRRTEKRGAHGHLNQYEHAIVVDRVNSLNEIGGGRNR